jgi:shikimate dehydrogenase
MKIQKLGLLGFPLTHSFSKKYFSEKFEKENIKGFQYDLYEISEIDELKDIFSKNPELIGLNVTIPYKQVIIPFLDDLDASAKRIGAVNVIKILADGKKVGYNSDYFGFKKSLEQWLRSENIELQQHKNQNIKALILGTGGASKAVKVALEDLNIETQFVSRIHKKDVISYQSLKNQLLPQIIINTTPLGMFPEIESFPDISYQKFTENHFLYDLVYNPEETQFLKKGKLQGAKTKNGLEMLHLQAEKAWAIWTGL